MKFKVISREEGRGKPYTKRFEKLEDAAAYIKDRWQGVEYMDGPASFHTDHSTYECVGFKLTDIGRVIYHASFYQPDRDFVFNVDKPPRHRIAVVRADDGEVHHYRVTPQEIEDHQSAARIPDEPGSNWAFLGHYDDAEYAAKFGQAFVDDLDGVLTPEEQDEYRNLGYANRHSEGQHASRFVELNHKVWAARAPVPPVAAPPDEIPF